MGHFCEKPVITTGAGDHFNAGFCHRPAPGIDIPRLPYTRRLFLGYYVRQAHSPTLAEATAFLRSW